MRSSSSSPTSSSPTRLRAALSRSNNKGPYAPSTPAADISRLLDPAYINGSSSSTARKTRRASAPVGVYVDHTGEFHDPDYRDFPVMNNTRRRRSEELERPTLPAWERGGMYASTYASASGSARTSGEDESRTRLYPSYYPAYPSPSAWSSSPSSSDDRPLHMYRSTMYQVGVDEDGVPRTPSLDSSGSKKPPRRRRSTKKLKKNRMEDMYQHEEEEADNIPLPTPFAAMLADRDDPMEETKPYVPDEVYVSFSWFHGIEC
jgi:hypothetical protein